VSGAKSCTATLSVALAAAVAVASANANANASQNISIAKRSPAHMLVYAQEWSLWPSRTTLPSGKVSVQLWNRGQDAHDLRVRRVNGAGRMVGHALGAPVTLSGAISHVSWTLRPGLYELFCSMPGHLARGMHVLVRVG
jgi:uncharacterized cupredoxin-like copper-binding protein